MDENHKKEKCSNVSTSYQKTHENGLFRKSSIINCYRSFLCMFLKSKTSHICVLLGVVLISLNVIKLNRTRLTLEKNKGKEFSFLFCFP